MTALIIVGIIVLLLVLLALLRVGVDVEYDGEIALRLCLGRIRIRLKKTEQEKKPDKAENAEAKPKKRGSVKELKALVEQAVDAAGYIRRRFVVEEITVKYRAAGGNPARVALEYGAGNAFLGIIAPIIENTFDVRRRSFTVEADFQGESPSVFMKARLTLRLWQLLAAAWRFVRGYMKTKKEKAVQK